MQPYQEQVLSRAWLLWASGKPLCPRYFHALWAATGVLFGDAFRYQAANGRVRYVEWPG